MNPLRIAVVVGKFPAVSETFIVNQIVFLKKQGHAVQILCLGELNKNDRSNAQINAHQLTDNAIDFKWQSIMPSNWLLRVLTALKILIISLFKGNFSQLFKTLNPFKYKIKALNLNAFYSSYFNEWFRIKPYKDDVYEEQNVVIG